MRRMSSSNSYSCLGDYVLQQYVPDVYKVLEAIKTVVNY